MSLLIEHAHLCSPGVEIADAFVAMRGDRVEAVGPANAAPPPGHFDTTLDVAGKLVVPGFFDIHTHGAMNADCSDGTLEALTAIGQAKLAEGTTSFLATGLTLPENDLRKLCGAAAAYAASGVGAVCRGIHLEGPFVAPEFAGAQNPAYLKMPDIGLVDRLNAVFPCRKLTFAPELPGAIEFTRELVKRGIMPSGGHSGADYATFCAASDAGMKHLSHFCNAMTPMHHLQFGMTCGGLLDDSVFVEIICDGVHLCDEMIRLIAKNKGAERVILITDAMRAAGMPDGEYQLGGLPVHVRNGRATLENGRVAGSTLRLCNGFRRYVENCGFPLSEAVRATSLNQALSLGILDIGKLAADYLADAVVLDAEFKVSQTILAGKIVYGKAS